MHANVHMKMLYVISVITDVAHVWCHGFKMTVLLSTIQHVYKQSHNSKDMTFEGNTLCARVCSHRDVFIRGYDEHVEQCRQCCVIINGRTRETKLQEQRPVGDDKPASAGNRTRVTSMATKYSTTRPRMLVNFFPTMNIYITNTIVNLEGIY